MREEKALAPSVARDFRAKVNSIDSLGSIDSTNSIDSIDIIYSTYIRDSSILYLLLSDATMLLNLRAHYHFLTIT